MRRQITDIDFLNTFNGGETKSDLYNLFIKHAKLYHFEKKTFIFYEEEPANEIYYIEKGLVKVCQSTLEGQNITFFVRSKDDVFGFAEVILEENRSRIAQCIDDSLIWVLDSKIFLNQVYNNPIMNKEFFQISNQRLIKQQRMVELLISRPTSWRLAWFLKEMSIENKENKFVCETTLTHMEISRIIGCSRQTVTEVLNKWKEQGLIEYNRNVIIISDIDKIFN